MEAWRHSDWNTVIVLWKLDSITYLDGRKSCDEHLETQMIQCPKVLFCISKIIMASPSMSIIPFHSWLRNQVQLSFLSYFVTSNVLGRYGFIDQMRRALKEYRNTFQLNGFHPRIIPSSSDFCSYGYKVQIRKRTSSITRLLNGPSILAPRDQPRVVGPNKMIVVYRIAPKFHVVPLVQAPSIPWPTTTYIDSKLP